MARHWPLLVIVAVTALLMLASLAGTSPVYDEPFHLTRGMVGWWTGDLRLSYDHPPLANVLEAAAARPMTAEPYPIRETHAWGHAAYKPLAHAWMRDAYPSFSRALGLARLTVVLMTLALVVVVHRFCEQHYDRRTAHLAALLVASQPVVLAHGRFVTTDMPVTLALMLAVVAFVGYLKRPTLPRALLVAVAVAAAALAKFTGLVLVALLPLLALVPALRGPRRLRALGRWVLHLGSGMVVICVLIGTAYRFEDTGWTVHDTLHQPVQRAMRGHLKTTQGSFLKSLPEGLRIPLPRRYVLGAVTTSRRASYGRGTYLLGREYERGTHWFFFALLPVKLTPALLLGLGVAAVARLRRRGLPRRVTTVLVLVAAALLLGAVRSRLNLGFRHLLPMLPLLAILAARGISVVWEAGGRWRRRLLLAVLVTAPVGALLEFPHYLGYFNALAGGRASGHRITLVGEDWGQDVAGLAQWAAEHPDEVIAYHPYVQTIGMQEARHRGLEATEQKCRKPLPRRGVVAVHAVVVLRGKCFPSLRIGDHFDHVHHHILLFRMPGAG